MMQHPSSESSDLSEFDRLAPEIASICASIASDIALVIDANGVIREVSCRNQESALNSSEWVGQRWVETVTAETRSKVERLLEEASAGGISRHREVNYRSIGGPDIAVNYAAIRLGSSHTILVAGRDLSSVSSIQQKFVERQQELERDYWQRRNRESHYRQLFQVATDSVLVVNSSDFRILEANLASAGLFDVSLDNLIGQDVADGIMHLYRPAVHELLVTARASGQPAEIRVPLARKIGFIALSATPFRSANGMQLLVRARATTSHSMVAGPSRRVVDFVERTPDAVVISDANGRVVMANPAFVRMCARSGAREVDSRPIHVLLGCSNDVIAAAIESVQLHGMASVQFFSQHAHHRIAYALAGALLDDSDQETIGFSIRIVDINIAVDSGAAPFSVSLTEQLNLLSAQIGERAFPSILEEAASILRQFFVDSVLQRAGGDPASAAAILGITEQEVSDPSGADYFGSGRSELDPDGARRDWPRTDGQDPS